MVTAGPGGAQAHPDPVGRPRDRPGRRPGAPAARSRWASRSATRWPSTSGRGPHDPLVRRGHRQDPRRDPRRRPRRPRARDARPARRRRRRGALELPRSRWPPGSSRRRWRSAAPWCSSPPSSRRSRPCYLAQLAAEAGLPDGVLNVVNGTGAASPGARSGCTRASTSSPSPARPRSAGTFLRYAADSNLKRVWLELGGKSANIVFPDAPDLDAGRHRRGLGDLLQRRPDVHRGFAPAGARVDRRRASPTSSSPRHRRGSRRPARLLDDDGPARRRRPPRLGGRPRRLAGWPRGARLRVGGSSAV